VSCRREIGYYILLVWLGWGFKANSVALAFLLDEFLHCDFKEAHEIGRTKTIPIEYIH